MKKMTKALSLFLAVLMLALPLAGCGAATSSAPESSETEVSASQPESSLPEESSKLEAEKADINIIGLKGPTALGMLQIMENNEAGQANNNYHFTLVGAPDEITSKLISGEVDIAAVPTNLASVLYNKTEGGVKLLALNTLGVLYMVTKNEEVASIADLKGKTVSVGAANSGVYFNAVDILGAYGIDVEKDISAVYQNFADSADSLKNGKVDAAFIVAGAPTTAITDLSTSKQAYLVSMDAKHIAKLQETSPYYAAATIPAGTYSGMDADTTTVSVLSVVLANNSVSEDDVYNFTKSLFDGAQNNADAHAKYKELDLETATSITSVPYHAGAAKYYKEQNVEVPTA